MFADVVEWHVRGYKARLEPAFDVYLLKELLIEQVLQDVLVVDWFHAVPVAEVAVGGNTESPRCLKHELLFGLVSLGQVIEDVLGEHLLGQGVEAPERVSAARHQVADLKHVLERTLELRPAPPGALALICLCFELVG